METQQSGNSYDPQFVRNMLESYLRIALLSLLLFWSFDIIRPFVVPIIWGAVIAIAVFPLVRWLQPKVGDRRGLAASIVTAVFIVLLVVPTWQVTEALVGSVQKLSDNLQTGELHVPPPPAGVAEWPLVGERVFETWTQANQNIEAVLDRAAPQIEELSKKLFRKMGSTLMGVLMFVVSLIIAGGFMTYAESCGNAAHRIFVRIGGLKPGGEWAPLTVATVRNVLKGVVGVAIIQTLLCVIGMAVMGIPGTPIWSVVILLLAIAQLPLLIVVAPIRLCLHRLRNHSGGHLRRVDACCGRQRYLPQTAVDGARAGHPDAGDPPRRHRRHDHRWHYWPVRRSRGTVDLVQAVQGVAGS